MFVFMSMCLCLRMWCMCMCMCMRICICMCVWYLCCVCVCACAFACVCVVFVWCMCMRMCICMCVRGVCVVYVYIPKLKLKILLLCFLQETLISFFGIHDPFGLRYLFQLKLSLSPLRSHKFHHNFIDTPSDNCHCNQGVDDTRHFLLACPLYVTQRVNLLTRINEILQKYKLDHLGDQLNLYLYGHNSINFVDNRDILISTLNYIKETRRFST